MVFDTPLHSLDKNQPSDPAPISIPSALEKYKPTTIDHLDLLNPSQKLTPTPTANTIEPIIDNWSCINDLVTILEVYAENDCE
jgi:hypothetical protein